MPKTEMMNQLCRFLNEGHYDCVSYDGKATRYIIILCLYYAIPYIVIICYIVLLYLLYVCDFGLSYTMKFDLSIYISIDYKLHHIITKYGSTNYFIDAPYIT